MIVLSVLIMLALAVAAIYCCYWLFIGLVYLTGMIVTAIQLRTGKLSREQLAANAAKYNEQKKQEKEHKKFLKWWSEITRPSVMDVVLGRSRRSTYIEIKKVKD